MGSTWFPSATHRCAASPQRTHVRQTQVPAKNTSPCPQHTSPGSPSPTRTMSKDASPSTRGAVRAWSSAPPSPAQARAAAASSASLSSSPSAFGSSASPPFATSVPKLFAALESRADQKARKKRQKQRGGRAARKVHPGRAGEMSEVGAGGAGGAGERRHERGDDGDGAVPLAAAVEKYPMYLIPVTSFMKLMEHVPAHQDLLEHGLLVEYEPDMEGRVIFVSHEWCAANNPDPDGVQMRCLQEVLRRMMYGELARIETNWKHQFAFKDNPHVTSKDMKAVCHMYLWIDYMCMVSMAWLSMAWLKGGVGCRGRGRLCVWRDGVDFKSVLSHPRCVRFLTHTLTSAPHSFHSMTSPRNLPAPTHGRAHAIARGRIGRARESLFSQVPGTPAEQAQKPVGRADESARARVTDAATHRRYCP